VRDREIDAELQARSPNMQERALQAYLECEIHVNNPIFIILA
jgi:hypothetical protein